MAVTNAYATVPELKSVIGVQATDVLDDFRLELALDAASRQIDSHCDRRFWQDTSVVDRQYDTAVARDPCDHAVLYVDDISTTTGLVVKMDTDDDGTFGTTLTINTDFVVEPVNAADEYPVRPYTQLRMLGSSVHTWFVSAYGRHGVQVTAKFGWSAVPDDVQKACLLQARSLFSADQAVYSTFGIESGVALRIRSFDQVAESLLARYRRVAV